MKSFFKFCCRVYQNAFKIAIPFLPYRQPTLISGFEGIAPVLKTENIHRVLIVTDKIISSLGLAENLKSILEQNDIKTFIYDGTVANPTITNVSDALKMYKDTKSNGIIGFGGGSSMDCAKALGVMVAYPKKKLDDLKGVLKVQRKLPLIIAIPTTAGTGSETTLASVIRNEQTKQKYAINSFPLIPRYAVLEPKVTISLPKHVTSTTGMDALTHAIEAYIGNSTTKKTRQFSLHAVKLIFANLKNAFDDGTNLEARKNMLEASYFAGCAFTVSYVGYIHAIAHSLGGYYDVPHGKANAIILPMILKAYGTKIDKKLKDLAIAAGIATTETPKEKAAQLFINEIENMNKYFGIGTTFPEIKSDDIPFLAAYAAKEANPLYPVPVIWDKIELQQFYQKLM